MYSLNMPVSKIRTKLRSEYEKHRYVNQLPVVDVLLFQGHSEFQVSAFKRSQQKLLEMVKRDADVGIHLQETLNYWKQLEHVMKYFRQEEDPTAKLPNNFISGFLEVGCSIPWSKAGADNAVQGRN